MKSVCVDMCVSEHDTVLAVCAIDLKFDTYVLEHRRKNSIDF